MVRQFFVLAAIFSLFSCENKKNFYPFDPNLTYQNGLPKDSLTFYFSKISPFDSSQTEFVRDSFWQNYLGSNLYAFKEPILYNQYLGARRYRFLWLRSFHLPMVFNLSNNDGVITLVTKKLDRQPLFYDRGYDATDLQQDSFYRAEGYQIIQKEDTFRGKPIIYPVVKGDRRANLIFNQSKTLSKRDWDRFESLLNNANYWKLKPYDWAGNTDGAVWIIEAHLPNSYRYVVRQSPGGKIKEIGKYLIDLSGQDEEVY